MRQTPPSSSSSSSSSLDSSLVQVQSCVSVSPCYSSSVRALAAAGAYLGMSSVILRMKSDFSAQPLQDSPHSSRIFFRSFTFSFFRSTVVRSSCLSTTGTRRERKAQTDHLVPGGGFTVYRHFWCPQKSQSQRKNQQQQHDSSMVGAHLQQAKENTPFSKTYLCFTSENTWY